MFGAGSGHQFCQLGRVTRELEKIIAERGVPAAIRCDSGRSSPRGFSWPGRWRGRSSWYAPNRGNRFRMRCRKFSWALAGEVLERGTRSGSWWRRVHRREAPQSFRYLTPREFGYVSCNARRQTMQIRTSPGLAHCSNRMWSLSATRDRHQ